MKLTFSKVELILLLGCLTFTACQTNNKKYELRGKVLEKNAAANQITVDHEDIPGFMSAMTMPYIVKDPKEIREVEPGDKIVADVATAHNGNEYWLENIRVVDRSERKNAKAAAPVHRLEVGEHVPNFPLTNQDGATIHLDDFKGKAMLVAFIYTRCPMPTFCPRLSSQFAAIHDNLVKTADDYRRTHLLSISFDPQYDTPAVLRKYGLAYLNNDPAGFGHWDFAVASASDLRKLADAFGLEYFEEGNQISHTMVIALIAPDGTVARYWATEWTAAELESAMREQSTRAGAAPRKGAR